MIDTISLIGIVDRTVDHITSLGGDLSKLYQHYSIPASPALSQKVLVEYLQEKIRSCFASDLRYIWRNCEQIKHCLIVKHIFDNKPLDPYLDVVEHIKDAVRTTSPIVASSDNWSNAIQASFDLTKIFKEEISQDIRRLTNVRDFAIAECAKRIRNRGYQIIVNEEGPSLSDSETIRLVTYLDTLVSKIGGINIVFQIFHFINQFWDPVQERYHLVRRVNPLGHGATPQIPFGYLYQLAARCPFPKNSCKEKLPDMWKELVELSRDFVALYDVQTYNTFEVMVKNHLSIIPFLQELALHDNIFTINQIRPLDVVRILRGVLDWVDQTQKQPGSWTLEEAVNIVDAILKQTRIRRGPSIITVKNICSLCPNIPPDRVDYILNEIFSHEESGANRSFLSPLDASRADFMFRPLFSFRRGEYLLFDPSACAPHFLEAIFSELRSSEQGFDDNIGPAIERFLKHELKTRGVTVSGGNYRAGAQEGECDLVIETKDTIIFIEAKKKPLTRQARGGSDVGILLDLAGSLIEAQLQTLKHEVAIRREGSLLLEDSLGKFVRIELANRDVERIALTLLDYGSFQDRTVLELFLTLSLDMNYLPRNSAFIPRFQRLAQILGELRQHVVELSTLDARRQKQPFFNSWFISVPQFLILLDGINCNEDFRKALWATRHFSTASLDFYFDYYYARNNFND